MEKRFNIRNYAPGLPNMPQIAKHQDSDVHFLPFVSINYDYIPDALETPKVLWVQLARPAPKNLRVGSWVRLHMTPWKGINTGTIGKSIFYVEDIIGSKVILAPHRDSKWLPTDHSCAPEGWGYDLRRVNVRPSRQTHNYGYGLSISYLEYHPHYYVDEPARLEDYPY